MAWYNKYRPQNFDEVIGQDLVKKVLQNALKKDKIKHAYLFCGPKGVGKTTIARIFANRLNDVQNNPQVKIDILEMDAASNTGIDDVRQLRESGQIPPINGKYKIYIIDEVHMLSKPAMNAFLKILEEPPEYLVFLLATTNPEKLISTVLSRLTRLNLSNHTIKDIAGRLRQIAEAEEVKIDDDSLELIAKRGSGSQRDAINLLETLASYELDQYDEKTTAELLGMMPEELLVKTAKWLLGSPEKNLFEDFESVGVDGESFLAQLLEFLLDENLQGRTQFESLILPIAEILDLKLPLTEITQVLALVSAKIGGKPLSHTPQKTPTPPPTSPDTASPKTRPSFDELVGEKKTEKAEPEPKKPQFKEEKTAIEATQPEKTEDLDEFFEFEESGGDNLDSESIEPAKEEVVQGEEPEKDVEKEKEEPVQNVENLENSEIDTAQIVETVLKLQSESDCPPALKMIMDLGARVDSESGKLFLSVSNGIFQTTLKSSKIQDWVKEKIKQKLGKDVEIDSEIRNGKSSHVIKIAEFDKKKPVQAESKPFPPKSIPSTQPVKQDTHKEGEIFYTVYKKLPENMENKGVPVKSEEIPIPEKKTEGDAHDEWDDHVDSFFELE